MKKEKNVNPVVIPKGKFADEFECCEYCEHNVDEKEILFISYKILCGIDGKWHDHKHVCGYYE